MTGQTSLLSRTRPIRVDGTISSVHFLNRTAVFVAGEESLLLVNESGDEQRVAAHAGAILSADSDGKALVTGGDDGRIVLTDAAGKSQTVAADDKRRWIDHVACGPDGALAWSAGKTAYVRTTKGETKSLDVVSTVGGLAFAPKGFRLAIAHYNGATLWFPNLAAKPEVLDWKGSHLGIAFSPNGKFLITAMQEPTLHGWRLADTKHMRMSGYAGRVRSMAWVAGGDYLATSGADQLILWPFTGKDGPMGKQPKMLAAHSARLAVVAGHPSQEVVAAGFADGMALLVRMNDGAEILVRKPGETAITALAFNRDGTSLAFGCENGEAGTVDLS